MKLPNTADEWLESEGTWRQTWDFPEEPWEMYSQESKGPVWDAADFNDRMTSDINTFAA